jgi:hypothetical protein
MYLQQHNKKHIGNMREKQYLESVAEAGQGHQDVCQTEQGQQVVEHALHTSEQRYIKRSHTK